MIRSYDYARNVAIIQSDVTGKRWEVSLGITKIEKDGVNTIFNFGELLLYRRCKPYTSVEDAKAALDLIMGWDDFNEKDDLIRILEEYISNKRSFDLIVRDSAIRECYGIVNGGIINNAVLNGKISARMTAVLTRRATVNLVNCLLEDVPGVAACLYPYPSNGTEAYRAVKHRHGSVPISLKEHLGKANKEEVVAAFRVASYVEKRQRPIHQPSAQKGARQWDSKLPLKG